MSSVLRRLVLLLLLILCGVSTGEAQLTVPRGAWRTFETPHFRVHYPVALDSIARIAAVHAESAHAQLSAEFLAAPSAKIDLVVADFTDTAYGAATGILKRVWINVHPALDERELNFFDDDLRLVIIHELTHVFHGDNTGGLWKRLGSVFGLGMYTKFNAITSPLWLVEGLAIHYESRFTEGGRLRAPYYDMILRTAALNGAFLTLDRVGGLPASWPGPGAAYIYGAHFVEHLVERHGQERVSGFVDRYGSQTIPLRLDAAAKRVFRRSLPALWSEWSDSLGLRYRAVADSLRSEGLTEPEILTREGGYATFPRYSPRGTELAYGSATGREQPATRLIGADGTVRAIARHGGLNSTSWLPDASGMIISQTDAAGHRAVADLYRVDRNGRAVRLTNGARLLQPDVHPEGSRAVAVHTNAGTLSLVHVDLASGTVRPFARAEDTHWAYPRWSPGGDRIAVGRWQRGGVYDIVVLDTAGIVLHEIARGRVVSTNPTWSPDGRYLVFSSDRSGISNLFAYDLEQNRLSQVTSVLSGAFEPDVSPDGRWIAFSYYQADGYRIARVPFDPSQWRAAPDAPSAPALPATAVTAPAYDAAPSRPYSVLHQGAPNLWSPFASYASGLGVGVGAFATAMDVLGHHEYDAHALVYGTGRVGAGLQYSYTGLGNAKLSLSLENRWAAQQVNAISAAGADTTVLKRLRRDRTARADVEFFRPRMRTISWLSIAADARDVDYSWADEDAARRGARLPERPLDIGVGLQVGYSSARRYRFSVGPEDGFTAWTGAQGRHFTAPLSGQSKPTGYARFESGASVFRGLDLPGFSRHSLGLAARFSADVGPRSPGFELGGAGSGAAFAVRGYETGAQVGDRAATVALQYRLPLLLVERGIGAVPFVLDRVWASTFADAGAAWCSARCGQVSPAAERPVPLTSIGVELSGQVKFLGVVGFTLTGGAALPLSETAASETRKPRFYLGTTF